LRKVLEVMKEHKLVADKKKCHLFVREVEFCGQVLGNGTRRPMPGKLRALENWERPRTVTELRGFLGFTNYFANYIPDYASLVAGLQEKLKLPRAQAKKGSRTPIEWTKQDEWAFETVKAALSSQLTLQRMNPDKPFVVRTDASRYAAGAVLEQLKDGEGVPTQEDILGRKTVPVAFMSRKLTKSQRNWTPREQETYAIILALMKWKNVIGLQPVKVVTDHKSLEEWVKETLDTPGGPVGRRSRWHEFLSKFNLEVEYMPGKTNMVADALSRWAYPASEAARDVTKHGTVEDKEEMQGLIEEEEKDERKCRVTTRSGKETKQQEGGEDTRNPTTPYLHLLQPQHQSL
jgi:hypothetical protein